VDRCLSPVNVLGRIAFLTLVGFAGILLIGPVLGALGAVIGVLAAVIGVCLPFFIIGLLLRLVFWFIFEQGVGRGLVRLFTATVGGVFGLIGGVLGLMIALIRGTWHKLSRFVHWGWFNLSRITCTAAGIMLETTGGAVIVGVLAGLTMHHLPAHQQGQYLAFGIIFGALFGLVVGISNYVPEKPCEQ
jgi:hypothetical protein